MKFYLNCIAAGKLRARSFAKQIAPFHWTDGVKFAQSNIYLFIFGKQTSFNDRGREKRSELYFYALIYQGHT